VKNYTDEQVAAVEKYIFLFILLKLEKLFVTLGDTNLCKP